jgi:hypothetical protein
VWIPSDASPVPGTLCKHDTCDAPAKSGFGQYCGARHWDAAIEAVRDVIHDPEIKKELRSATRQRSQVAIEAIQRGKLDRIFANTDATAFDQTMKEFFQVRATYGAIPAINYAKFDAKVVKRDQGRRPSRWVKPNDADFCADICNAAKQCLSPRLFAFFDLVWVQGRYQSLPGQIHRQLQRILGREFRRRKIWPSARYRAGKFV